MALARPLFVGFSSCSKMAREGGDLEVALSGRTRGGRGRVFTLPWFFVRQVDALLERWRREEHEATLLTMNDGEVGATLCDAAKAGGLRDVTFLLASGANVNYMDEAFNAMGRAAQHGHLAVVQVLLDAGALGLDGALNETVWNGHPPVAALLLDRGADVHFIDDWPLLRAARQGNLEMMRLLLNRGADQPSPGTASRLPPSATASSLRLYAREGRGGFARGPSSRSRGSGRAAPGARRDRCLKAHHAAALTVWLVYCESEN